MSGYTTGTGKALSEESLAGSLFHTTITLKDTTKKAIENALDNADVSFNQDELDNLVKDQETSLGDYTCNYASIVDNQLELDNDELTVIEEMEQGGVHFLVEGDEVVGALYGVAGEHIGSVSCWLDTYNGYFYQDGQAFPISEEDKDTFNYYEAEVEPDEDSLSVTDDSYLKLKNTYTEVQA